MKGARITKGIGLVAAGVAALLLSTGSAHAQLSGSSGSNGGSTCTGANNADGFCGSSTAFTVNTGSTFTNRYAWNITADVGAGSTRDTSGNSTHTVSFTATAPGSYRVNISESFVGAMGRSSDILNCDGRSDVSGVGASTNIALTSGSLGVADPGAIGNGGGDSNLAFSPSASAFIDRLSNGAGQAHTLTFTWNGSVRSNSCEAAVRLGQQNGTTTGCAACEYSGSPSRTQSSDGHFVTVSFTSFCGDGVVNGVGEQCDLGGANGSATSCCNSNCTFRAAAQVCRASAGVCDPQEVCTGGSGT
jgi:hypothetical protein